MYVEKPYIKLFVEEFYRKTQPPKNIGNNSFFESLIDASSSTKSVGAKIFDTAEGYCVLTALEGLSGASWDLVKGGTLLYERRRNGWYSARTGEQWSDC